jgi:hypothetical protein
VGPQYCTSTAGNCVSLADGLAVGPTHKAYADGWATGILFFGFSIFILIYLLVPSILMCLFIYCSQVFILIVGWWGVSGGDSW